MELQFKRGHCGGLSTTSLTMDTADLHLLLRSLEYSTPVFWEKFILFWKPRVDCREIIFPWKDMSDLYQGPIMGIRQL